MNLPGNKEAPPILWRPDHREAKKSQLFLFHAYLKGRGLSVPDLLPNDAASYLAFHNWTTKNLDKFWGEFASWSEFCFVRPAKRVLKKEPAIRKSRWFEGALLNAAENLLRHRGDDEALVFVVEGEVRRRLTYRTLHAEVATYQRSMRALGIGKGDRVCGLVANMPEAVLAMLATLSLGAVWSSCSPDFGKKGVLDRFGQIDAALLFAVDSYQYKGKRIDCKQLLSEVAAGMPSLKAVVEIPFPNGAGLPSGIGQDTNENPAEAKTKKTDGMPEGASQRPQSSTCPLYSLYSLEEFLSKDFAGPKPSQGQSACPDATKLHFAAVPFSHPIYIMYSSGTTGLPKCLVQGAGVILNHAKEHLLHGNLQKGDTIFFYTTCGWMMWNWLVSALFCGARIVLYEGSPVHPHIDVLFRMAEKEKINYFGTSPKYLSLLEDAGFCAETSGLDLSPLKAMLSTGAPLSDAQFFYVYKNIKSNIRLSSISGGTDLNGCFALGNPALPVRAGELQSKGLGMAVQVERADGKICKTGEGELVCTEPFPSMPLFFWKDEDGEKYRHAYFEKDEGVWRHGDYIFITEEGGLRFFGRSDATLNPGGVRIGTADLYNVLEELDFVEDSIAIGQPWKNDVRVVLFVSLKDGLSLDDALRDKIKRKIRSELTPRHVPAKILQVSAIPYTHNGKKVELAVKKAVLGEPIPNTGAIARPELLDEFRNRPELSEPA